MRPMSWNFGEIHGVDVSDEMIRLASEKLVNVPNAFPRSTDGTDLSVLRRRLFRFRLLLCGVPAYSQPGCGLLVSYRSAPGAEGGRHRCTSRSTGFPRRRSEYTTWEGVRIGAAEMAEFASAHDFQLLAMEGVDTQYMWITMRKQPDGWFGALTAITAAAPRRASAKSSIRTAANRSCRQRPLRVHVHLDRESARGLRSESDQYRNRRAAGAIRSRLPA